MKFNHFLFPSLIIVALFCISCSSKSTRVALAKNDTVEILQTLFDSTINLSRLLDIERLYLNNPFNDSIMVVTNPKVFQKFPVRRKFKLLTSDSLCKMYNFWNKSKPFPNFLRIEIYRFNDTLYKASVSNFRIDNSKYCIPSLNQACYKSMTFRKTGNEFISKLEKTLYD